MGGTRPDACLSIVTRRRSHQRLTWVVQAVGMASILGILQAPQTAAQQNPDIPKLPQPPYESECDGRPGGVGVNRNCGVNVPRNAPTRTPRPDCSALAAGLREAYQRITAEIQATSDLAKRDRLFRERLAIIGEWESLQGRCGDQGKIWDSAGPPDKGRSGPSGRSSGSGAQGAGGGARGGSAGGTGPGSSAGGTAGGDSRQRLTKLVLFQAVHSTPADGAPKGAGIATLIEKDSKVRNELRKAVRTAIESRSVSDLNVVEPKPNVDTVAVPDNATPAIQEQLAGLNARLVELGQLDAFARSYGRYLAAKSAGNKALMAKQAEAMATLSRAAMTNAIEAEYHDNKADRMLIAAAARDSSRETLSAARSESLRKQLRDQMIDELKKSSVDDFTRDRVLLDSGVVGGSFADPQRAQEGLAVALANVKERAAHSLAPPEPPDLVIWSEPADAAWLREIAGIAHDALMETGQADKASGPGARRL